MSTEQVSRVRDELLRQGTLTVDQGYLRFTTPGMATCVLERERPDQRGAPRRAARDTRRTER